MLIIQGLIDYPLPIFLNNNFKNQSLEYAIISGNKVHHFKSGKDHSKDVQLREIVTGNGVVETIYYKPLIQKSSPGDEVIIYKPTYDAVYPNVDLEKIPAIQIVSKLEQKSLGQTSKQVFSYYGGTSNLEGLGFLGFKSVLRSNWYNDDFSPKI